MRIMFGLAAALLLAVTLISTALSLAEQQADMGTFAAVGATRRTRRALAGSQAVVVGLIGAVLGVVVGLFPGIAISYPLTATSWNQITGEEVRSGPDAGDPLAAAPHCRPRGSPARRPALGGRHPPGPGGGASRRLTATERLPGESGAT